MILVDTNILIDFFNAPTSEAATVFLYNNVATCGIVHAELLHGSKDEKDSAAIQAMLSGLGYVELTKDDWTQVGLLLARLRGCGLSVPMADAIIAYLALREDAEIWTNDRHFTLMKAVLPGMRIFEP